MTTNSSFSVKGKRAFITGAGSGINYCLASLLLSNGCSVLIADLALRTEAQKLIEQYSSGSPRALFQKTDVTEWIQLQNAFEVCIKEFGGIDIVGPGAGVYEPPFSNFWFPPGSKESKDAVDGNTYKTLDINITHPIRATQLAISYFLNPTNAADKASSSNPKRIVMTSSIAGQIFGIPTPLYIASKHAISAFARSMGDLEEKVGIRVNCVAPGVVRTPLWYENPEKMRMVNEEVDKWVTPEEVAEVMVRLMEDQDLVGGTILEVGKGSTRVVPPFMNPGPAGEGMSAENAGILVEEAYAQLGTKGWGQTH